MERNRSRRWIVAGGMVAVLVVPAVIVVGVLIGGSEPDKPHVVATAATPGTATQTSGNALAGDRLAALEASGKIASMVEQHQAMMDRMRANATPQMLQLMNSDPMWQMMRSGEYVRLLQQHEADIDRMLARGG